LPELRTPHILPLQALDQVTTSSVSTETLLIGIHVSLARLTIQPTFVEVPIFRTCDVSSSQVLARQRRHWHGAVFWVLQKTTPAFAFEFFIASVGNGNGANFTFISLVLRRNRRPDETTPAFAINSIRDVYLETTGTRKNT